MSRDAERCCVETQSESSHSAVFLVSREEARASCTTDLVERARNMSKPCSMSEPETWGHVAVSLLDHLMVHVHLLRSCSMVAPIGAASVLALLLIALAGAQAQCHVKSDFQL